MENIHIEYRHESGFHRFLESVRGKRIALLCDVNTSPYARSIHKELCDGECEVEWVEFPDRELIPTEDKCALAYRAAERADYVLAVGSGTLNDMAKSAATRSGIPSGVMVTAASMDGYCSAGSALMRGGVKVTDPVNPPSDILIDLDIVCNAPKRLTAAGFGDIVGKYTCLADWRLSHLVNGEAIDGEAYARMEHARTECMNAYDGLIRYENDAVSKLMEALISAGISMAMCGNSRPASGSEHHQSHFLEMDFIRRAERVPEHGIKVAIGTMVSLCLYKYIATHRVPCKNAQDVYALAESLPSEEHIRDMLVGLGCPVRFSEIGVSEQTMKDMLRGAHKVRDRYTVLTFANETGIIEAAMPEIIQKYL